MIEQSCRTCIHANKDIDDYPCRGCVDEPKDHYHWAPKRYDGY